MALIVEDGTLVTGAESYVTVAEADAYWTDRGLPTQWVGLDTSEKESALRQATEKMEVDYTWRSCLQSTTQPLSFPRLAFYDREGRLLAGEGVIPQDIKNAQIEIAIRIAIDNARLDTNPNDDNIIRERVGDHEVQYESGSINNFTIYAYVEKLLRRYTLGSLNTIRIIRG